MIDFSRSFVTFRIDAEKRPPTTASHKPPYSLNNARIQLECRCRVTRVADNATRSFVLGASCKTERVGVEREIWTTPNADFAPIFSDDEFMHIKTYAQAGVQVELFPPGSGNQSDRQTGRIADAFDDVRIDIVECLEEELTSPEDIVRATLNNEVLVARNELSSSNYRAVLEYPVKTINANERDMIYQTDTGPVLLPDLSCEPGQLQQRFELAFAAFNCPDWVEFLARDRTKVAEGVDVYHFSRPLRLDSRNTILRTRVEPEFG